MLPILIGFVVLGLAGIPLFISLFDEQGKRVRRERDRKTALTVRIGRRAHQP